MAHKAGNDPVLEICEAYHFSTKSGRFLSAQPKNILQDGVASNVLADARSAKWLARYTSRAFLSSLTCLLSSLMRHSMEDSTQNLKWLTRIRQWIR